MPATADKRQLAPVQLADLSRLPDGTIDRARASEVRAQVSASPRLTELYERERRAVAAVHEARARDRAPAALRARIEVQRTLAQSQKRRRVRYQLSLVGALAALVGAVVLVAPSGVPAGPSVSQAAALGPRGPEAPAPATDPSEPAGRLDASLQNVYFPDWWARCGWRATGQREDRIDGRLARTIYYASGKTTLSYTIVLHPPSGCRPARRYGSTGPSSGRSPSAGGWS
jgi:hypothetical protein